MVKITGTLMISLACAATGLLFSNRLSTRVNSLETLVSFFTSLLNQMRYSAAPLYDLLKLLSSQPEHHTLFFPRRCIELCEEGMLLPDALKKAIKESQKQLQLQDDDVELLIHFGESLGTTDIEGQLSSILLYQNLLSEHLKQAYEQKQTNGKLYRRLGLLGGIGLSLFLL